MTATFEQVVAQSRQPVTSMASRVLGDRYRGEDVAQDAFTALYRDWDRVTNPVGFIWTAVRNRCRDVQRREIHAREKLSLLRPLRRSSEEGHYLADVVAKLPALRRQIVVLRFYGGHSLPEISEITGVPVGTVKSNLHRALDQLRADLSFAD